MTQLRVTSMFSPRGKLVNWDSCFLRYAYRRRLQFPPRCRRHIAVVKDSDVQITHLKVPLGKQPKEARGPVEIAKHDEPSGRLLTGYQNTGQIGISSQNNKPVKLPPSLRHIRQLLDDFKDHVVLVQMGSFYELYFEQAVKYAPKLSIALTSKKYAHGATPFAGFPVSQLYKYLKILISDYGYSVAIVDQFKETDSSGKNTSLVTRKVSRIVTPGTFVDEAFENSRDNTYLLNIRFPQNCVKRSADPDLKVGLCWCDISTGEIFVQEVLLRDLASTITRIDPKEILLDEGIRPFEIETGKWYSELVILRQYFVKYWKTSSRSMESLLDLFSSGIREQLRLKLCTFTQKESASLHEILEYIAVHLPDAIIDLEIPQRQLPDSIMQIDFRTSKALELHTRMLTGSEKGSLLSSIRRTVTPVGTRLLTRWLSAPSMDLEEIKKRQMFVAFFLKSTSLTKVLTKHLREISDMSRILQKFNFGKGSALDLIQIARSLRTATVIRDLLLDAAEYSNKDEQRILSEVSEKLRFDTRVADDILNLLEEEEIVKEKNGMATSEKQASVYISENHMGETSVASQVGDIRPINFFINPKNSKQLSELHSKYQVLVHEKFIMEQGLRQYFVDNYKIKKVELRQRQNGEYAVYLYGPASYIQRVSKSAHIELNKESCQVLQKSAQSCWLSYNPWVELGVQLELSQLMIKREEERIINGFKSQLLDRSGEIRTLYDVLGYIDVLSSFAVLARERNWVCPVVDSSYTLEILGGRHLVVEDSLLGRSLGRFVPNNCKLESGHTWIITGPNMGGKSTFLRQNAIIVILAQIGSFVPCDSAKIGLVDKIFSRVGSADDLYNEMSTFMVEMIETSFILQGATKRSLAILDEVGRGTSGKEGVCIAYATLSHLVKQNQCRTLFSTHFGTDIKKILDKRNDKLLFEKVKFFRSKIINLDEDHFLYDHKLQPGVCVESDALKVVKAAGFPRVALEEAKELLAE